MAPKLSFHLRSAEVGPYRMAYGPIKGTPLPGPMRRFGAERLFVDYNFANLPDCAAVTIDTRAAELRFLV